MSSSTMLHHVVFAVARERLDAATEYLEALGFEFQPLELEHLGLQVRLDWDRGFELISPGPDAPSEPGSAADFLARQGDGLFTVVVRVESSSAAEDIARRYGAEADFRQDFEGDGHHLHEVKLTPVAGVPLTLLQTNVH